MISVLPSVLVLGLAALGALALVRFRRSPPEKTTERRAAARALALAVAAQTVHFGEEAATGLHQRLGGLLDLPGMPFSLFVAFNLAWLLIWVISVPALRARWTAAFFAAWFLAIAGMVNGIGHPLLALASGGYFPGLLSSPLVGAAGVWLWLRLGRATQPRGSVATG